MKNLFVGLIMILMSSSVFATANPDSYRCEVAALPSVEVDTLVRNVLDPSANERLTIEVMRQVAERRAHNQDTVVGWLDSMKASQTDHPLDLLEHSALLFILKNGAFDDNATATKSLEDVLSLSYAHLTGREPVRDDIRSPLPGKLFSASDERARLFHDAIFDFEKADEKPTLRGRVKRIAAKITTSNLVTSLLTMATLSYEPGREMFAGALIGLTEAAFNEYLVHIGVGHAPKSATNVFRKWGKVGRFLEEITLAHKLHHTVVSEDFGAAILTPDQKERAEKTLLKLAQNLTLDRMREKNPAMSDDEIRSSDAFKNEVTRLVNSIRTGNYGTNGTTLGAIGMIATATPFYLLNQALFAATGSHEFLISADVALTGMIVQSLYSHWHFHFRASEHPEMKVNALQSWYMTTAVGKFSQRLHFTHHELPYAYARTKNGDIMAGSVADRLTGNLQKTSVIDLINMYDQGLLGQAQQLLRP